MQLPLWAQLLGLRMDQRTKAKRYQKVKRSAVGQLRILQKGRFQGKPRLTTQHQSITSAGDCVAKDGYGSAPPADLRSAKPLKSSSEQA